MYGGVSQQVQDLLTTFPYSLVAVCVAQNVLPQHLWEHFARFGAKQIVFLPSSMQPSYLLGFDTWEEVTAAESSAVTSLLCKVRLAASSRLLLAAVPRSARLPCQVPLRPEYPCCKARKRVRRSGVASQHVCCVSDFQQELQQVTDAAALTTDPAHDRPLRGDQVIPRMHQRADMLDKIAPLLGLRAPSWQPGPADEGSPTIKAAAHGTPLGDSLSAYPAMATPVSSQLASHHGASLDAYSLPAGGPTYRPFQEQQEAVPLQEAGASSLRALTPSTLGHPSGSLDSQVRLCLSGLQGAWSVCWLYAWLF